MEWSLLPHLAHNTCYNNYFALESLLQIRYRGFDQSKDDKICDRMLYLLFDVAF